MFSDEETEIPSVSIVPHNEDTYEQAKFWREFIDPIENPEEQHNLKLALKEHIWEQCGDTEE